MNLATILMAFLTVFLAEIGDKTQLAVITMCASTGKPVSVFIGAAVALVLVTAVGALFGQFIMRIVSREILEKAAASAFIGIGVVMLIKK